MSTRPFALLLALAACSSPDDPKPSDGPPDPETEPSAQDVVDLDNDGHAALSDGGDDCDDADAAVFPGAAEVPYDGIDQDCAGGDLVDVDVDGITATEVGGEDCDDADPDTFPGAPEVPYDGVDQDCAGGDLVDVDVDGVTATEAGGEDCDDADPATFPDAPDTVGDGLDQSCDGIDGWDADADGYAWTASGGFDCDDADAAVNPGAAEVWYDGLDQDCDRACDGDQDGDGSVADGWAVVDGDDCDEDAAVGEVLAPSDCDDLDPLAEAVLLAFDPADGELGVRLSPLVGASFEQVDATATLELVDAAGAVPAIVYWDGTDLLLEPVAPLAPLTTYTATLTWGCGSEVWSFTTSDGTDLEIWHTWTYGASGAPDMLVVDVVNATATRWAFALAETGAGVVGWYGEDCIGPLATGDCHPMRDDQLVLESVYPDLFAVVPGESTLFDATFDSAITYYLEALDGVDVGTCWSWGHDPGYFAGCLTP